MRTAKKIRKSAKATSLDHAIDMTEEFAEQKRMPSKVMCELMGVEYKTYRRWMTDGTMPLNRLIQMERLAGCQFISEYLCVFHGGKIVVDMPRGRKVDLEDVSVLQVALAEAVSSILKFYQGDEDVGDVISKINDGISRLAFQRENVQKNNSPELMFGDDDE